MATKLTETQFRRWKAEREANRIAEEDSARNKVLQEAEKIVRARKAAATAAKGGALLARRMEAAKGHDDEAESLRVAILTDEQRKRQAVAAAADLERDVAMREEQERLRLAAEAAAAKLELDFAEKQYYSARKQAFAAWTQGAIDKEAEQRRIAMDVSVGRLSVVETHCPSGIKYIAVTKEQAEAHGKAHGKVPWTLDAVAAVGGVEIDEAYLRVISDRFVKQRESRRIERDSRRQKRSLHSHNHHSVSTGSALPMSSPATAVTT